MGYRDQGESPQLGALGPELAAAWNASPFGLIFGPDIKRCDYDRIVLSSRVLSCVENKASNKHPCETQDQWPRI